MPKTKTMKISTNKSPTVAAQSNGAGFDVKALRAALGKLTGKASVSRSVLAELLGVSSGSIFNWERGTSISATNLVMLRDLAKRVATGNVKLPERRKGGRPKRAKNGSGGTSSPAKRASTAPNTPITGSCPLLYGNVIQVDRGSHDARVRFAVTLPGGETRAVADVVVPLDVLESLA